MRCSLSLTGISSFRGLLLLIREELLQCVVVFGAHNAAYEGLVNLTVDTCPKVTSSSMMCHLCSKLAVTARL